MYSLQETVPRGFFSNLLSILTSSKFLHESRNIAYNDIFISPSCFSLYGDPKNWFEMTTINTNGQQFDTLQASVWGCANDNQLQLHLAHNRFPWNSRVLSLIANINVPTTTLGIHFRGLDHNSGVEGARENLDKYLIMADKFLSNSHFTHVFIASDEQGIPEKIKNYLDYKFPHLEVLYYNHFRNPPGKTGVHSTETICNKIQLADQAILDVYTLAKCSTVIGKSTSNFINWLRYCSPLTQVHYVDRYKRIIQPFIFNWPGQTNAAKATYAQLRQHGYNPIVINSDPEYQPFDWINLGNTAWFSHQWNLATDLFTGDILFHIQADATYNNWNQLIQDAEKYLDKYNWGIYSPRFQDNGHYVPLQGWHCEDENILAVPNPDCTCWFLHKDIIQAWNTLKHSLHLENNKYGWGIDCIMCALSWQQNRIVLRDFAHEVFHKPGRGYDSSHANTLMYNMFQNLEPDFFNIVKAQWQDKESLLDFIKHV